MQVIHYRIMHVWLKVPLYTSGSDHNRFSIGTEYNSNGVGRLC